MKAFAFSTMSALRTLAACGNTPVSVIHRNRVECRSAFLASPFDVRAIVIDGDGQRTPCAVSRLKVVAQ